MMNGRSAPLNNHVENPVSMTIFSPRLTTLKNGHPTNRRQADHFRSINTAISPKNDVVFRRLLWKRAGEKEPEPPEEKKVFYDEKEAEKRKNS